MKLINAKIETINEKYSAFLQKLRKCQNDDISDLLNQILGKENEEDEENNSLKIKNSIGNSMNKSAHLNNLGELEENGSATNISFRISHAINHIQHSTRRANNIKIKNRRTKEAIGFGKTWAYYVDKICNSRTARELSNQEQDAVSIFIFDELTKKEENENDRYDVMSLKKFISNAIDYTCDCENETWTVYLVIFIFKLFGNLCKR